MCLLVTRATALLVVTLLATSFCHAQTDAAGIGLNKFDLVNQYMGKASGGDGTERYRRVTQAMGRKAIADAHDAGVTYLRISATGFAPSAFGHPGDMDLWITDPNLYWAHMDELMNDMEAMGMRGVFTFVWNSSQFPAMAGETVHDLLTSPQSRSYQMVERFVSEFIQRYKDRKAVFFYELTNELNLSADLDIESRCYRTQPQPLCEVKSNFTTSEMVGFAQRLAKFIRGLDPSRPISSGFSVPRSAAEHLRAKPEWVTGKADFTPDSVTQLENNLRDINVDIDLISVHLYPTKDNARFGIYELRNTAILDIIKKIADKLGKQLFVGEFGDSEIQDGSRDSYTVQMIERIQELKVPYSAVWTWEFYQFTTYETRNNQHTVLSLEPGFTDAMIDRIHYANERIRNYAHDISLKDITIPHVVLTWPLECAQLQAGMVVYGVASDNSGKVRNVEFWLDSNRLASDTIPPYQTTVNINELNNGDHILSAKAFDLAGNKAEFRSIVVLGQSEAVSRCALPVQ